MRTVHRTGIAMVAILLAAACAGESRPTPRSTFVDGGGAPTGSAAPTASPAPTTSPSPTTTATLGAAPTIACPSEQEMISVERFAALPPPCASVELTVAGWWDRPRGSDQPDAETFDVVLRDRIPTGDPPEGLDYGAWLPLETRGFEGDTAAFQGRWTELRVRLGRDDQHCYWRARTDETPSAEFPPIWTCPAFAQVLAATVTDPPTGALTACPDRSTVIAVEDFVRYPRACFGQDTVEIAGWFDTQYLISGWEEPWQIEPGWLWSVQIGAIPVLAGTSNANDRENLLLHIRPGTPIHDAAQHRWVTLRGHYARAQEYEACHFEFPDDWYGEVNPVAGTLDDADAKADCAHAFVAESVRDAPPQ